MIRSRKAIDVEPTLQVEALIWGARRGRGRPEGKDKHENLIQLEDMLGVLTQA